jgi:hypothetical protein
MLQVGPEKEGTNPGKRNTAKGKQDKRNDNGQRQVTDRHAHEGALLSLRFAHDSLVQHILAPRRQEKLRRKSTSLFYLL